MNLGWIKFAYWKFLSKPAQDRVVYRLIDRGDVTSILEIGVGSAQRAERMIALASRHHRPDQIRYAGMDLFEARPAGSPGLSLKDAFRKLSPSGVPIRLLPGELLCSLLRCANTLSKTDLVVINGIDQAVLEPAWFYFPRMLHEKSTVLLELGNVKPEFQPLSYTQVSELAKKAASCVRRAG